MEKKGSLEIDENYEHHVRAWRAKRVFWGIMAATVVAAVAGFLGPGPYSSRIVTGENGLKAEFESRLRHNARAHINLTVPGGEDDLEVSVNVDFLDKIELHHIEPEPKESRLNG